MGILTNALFEGMLSWVQALVNGVWALFTTDRMTLLEFFGRNWFWIALIIVAAGLVVDWLVWLIRWQPYHMWAIRMRKLLHIGAADEEDEDDDPMDEDDFADDEDDGEEFVRVRRPHLQDEKLPEEEWTAPAVNDEDAREVYARAESAPDETVYPGMRYDAVAPGTTPVTRDTQRFSAIRAEGPGAAEVERRRAEIDAWQQQMQDEAREKARLAQEAARAEEERRKREAYEAEQARLAAEAAARAEQERIAAEAAARAEQERLAQEAYAAEQARMAEEARRQQQAEEYARQMAEYERAKAQYERDLAEYQQKKAEYDAQMESMKAQTDEFATRRRRAISDEEIGGSYAREVAATYSDYVEGDSVENLPDAPDWPQMREALVRQPAVKKAPKKENGLLARAARMFEAEDEEITGVRALPPRIDRKEAYHPAKKPRKR